MPNYLNKPLSAGFRNTYTSQFVPLPLELFARANERDQRTQDNYVAQTEATSDGIWKINPVASEDKQYVDTFKQGFSDAASDLVKKDLTQRENQDSVKSLIKNTSRDKDLNHIMAVSAQYQTAQETRSKMMADNTYNRFNDVAADSYEDYVKSGGYKSGKGLSTDIIKYEDTRPAREKLVDDMKASGNDIVGQFGETFYKNGYEGISKSQAYNTAKSSLGEYMQTNAGAQDAREFKMMQRSNPKNKQLQKMDASDYIFSKILTAANERVFNKTTSGLADAKNADKKAKKEEANLGTFASEGQNTNLGGGYDLSDRFDTTTGEFKGHGKGFFQTVKEGSWTPAGIYKSVVAAANDTSMNPADAEDAQMTKVTVAAKLNGKRPVDYYNQHAGADVKQFTLFDTLPKKKQEAYQNQIFNEFGSGVFDNMTAIDPVTGEKGKFSELLRKSLKDNPVLDSKGKPLSLDSTPTNAQVVSLVKAGVISLKGENKPNRFSAKSLMLGFGNKELMLDRTNNGKLTSQLLKTGQLTKREVDESNVEAIKAEPKIEMENGKQYIHYWHDEPRQVYNAKTRKNETIAPGVASEELTPELMKNLFK